MQILSFSAGQGPAGFCLSSEQKWNSWKRKTVMSHKDFTASEAFQTHSSLFTQMENCWKYGEKKTICLVLMRVETSKEVEQMRNDRVTSASGGRGGTFWCFRWRFSSCRNLSRSFSSCFLTKSSQGVNWKHDFQWLELLPKKPIKNSSSANANVCGS